MSFEPSPHSNSRASSLEVNHGSVKSRRNYNVVINQPNSVAPGAYAVHAPQTNGYATIIHQRPLTDGTSSQVIGQANGTAILTPPTSYTSSLPVPGLVYSAASNGTYYLPAISDLYSQPTTTYANEITFEDDPSQLLSQPASPRNHQHLTGSQNISAHIGTQRTPTATQPSSHGSAESHRRYSQATRRWSVEHSPEECIRLGIPCYSHVQQDQQQSQRQNHFEHRPSEPSDIRY